MQMSLNKQIGFIGGGNMGEAFIGAILRSGVARTSEICVCDIDRNRLQDLQETYGVESLENNIDLFTQCDVVVLAVKPQVMPIVLADIINSDHYAIGQHKLIISIAAGITIEKLEQHLYAPLEEAETQRLPIIRVMPNTPALVLAGMSGMSANRHAQPADIKITETLLEAMGEVIIFEESDIDAVTALSGSGPAYVFYLAEAMIEAGIQLDLDPNDAVAMTLQTLKGAVKLMEEKKESPESLRRKVTSPGGTTEAAIDFMALNSVKETIIEAIAAAAKRSRELSR
jgi:pyrroline-5-carboxylate reductase